MGSYLDAYPGVAYPGSTYPSYTSALSTPTVSIKAWAVAAPADGSMPTSTATEIVTRTTKMSIARGRQYELDKDQVGTLALDVRNDDGLFSGGHTYQPLMPVHVTATYAGTTYDLFTGYWESLPWENPSPLEGTAKLAAQDISGAWSQRTLAASMTEYILASTTPTLYLPLSSTTPLVGIAVDTALNSTGAAKSGFTGSFGGDGAFSWDPADKAGVTGRLNSSGAIMFPPSTQWWAMVGFSLTSSLGADKFPLLSLLDNTGDPIYQLFYSAGSLHFRAYVGDNISASATATSMSTPVSVVGEHVALIGHDGTNLYLAVDGLTVASVSCPWVGHTIRQWAVGTPLSVLGFGPSWSRWAASGDGTGAWAVSSPITMYGLGLFVGQSQPAWSWASEPLMESIGTSPAVTNIYAAAKAWSGVTSMTWDSDATPVAWPSSSGTTLLQYVQDTADSTEARAFIAKSGAPTIRSRDMYQIPGSVKWVFGYSSGGGRYPYTGSPQFAYDLTRVYSAVKVTSTGHTGFASNSTVPHAQQREWSVSSNGIEVQSQAEWLLGRYSQAKPRPASLTFNPVGDPDLWPMVLGVELGDFVQLIHQVPGKPDINLLGFVESIAHDVDASAGTWVSTIQMSPNLGSYWKLADTTYSVLGTTTRNAWSTAYWVLGDSNYSLVSQTTRTGWRRTN